MLITLDTIQYVHKNERDLEIPAVLKSVSNHIKDIDSLLDVGCHWSWAYYANQLREILQTRKYDGIDIIIKEDNQTPNILDKYHVGDICSTELPKYDYVACISSIEHCGLSTYKRDDFRAEQHKVFSRLLDVANKYLFLSFPFGLDHVYEGEYANITDLQLLDFTTMAAAQSFIINDLQFYFNEFSPGGEPWQYISWRDAAKKPMIKEKGTQCVGIIEWAKVV